MNITDAQDPADRFTTLMGEICHVLNRYGAARFVAGPMLLLIFNRINRMARLFAGIAKRVGEGTISYELTKARGREAAVCPVEAGAVARVRPARVPAAYELPGHFGWLIKMIPEADLLSTDLRRLLQKPEMEALIFEAGPQLGRILRPLCMMLGVEVMADLRLPLWGRMPPPAAAVVEIAPAEVAPTLVASAAVASGPAEADDGAPQLQGSQLFWEMEQEFWQFHRPRGPPKLE